MKITEIVPDGTIKIPIKWLGLIVLTIASVSIGYGEYRSQATQAAQDRQDLHAAISAINDLRVEMSDLQRAVTDLRDELKLREGR